MRIAPAPAPASGDAALDRKLLALLPDLVVSTRPIGKQFPCVQIELPDSETPVAIKAFRELAKPRPLATTTAIARWLLAVAQGHRDRDDGCGVRAPDWQSLPAAEAQPEFRARYNRWMLLHFLADLLSLSRGTTDEQLLLDGLPSVSSEEAKAIVVRALRGGALQYHWAFERDRPAPQPPLQETIEQVCNGFARHARGLYVGPLALMGDQRELPGIAGLHRDDSPLSWGPMRQLAELVMHAGAERSHRVLSPLLAPPEPAYGILGALANRPEIAVSPVWLTTLVPLAAGAFEAPQPQRWSVMREALNTLGDSPIAWVQVVAAATDAWVRDEALQQLATIGKNEESRTELLGAIRAALDGPLATQRSSMSAMRLKRLR